MTPPWVMDNIDLGDMNLGQVYDTSLVHGQ